MKRLLTYLGLIFILATCKNEDKRYMVVSKIQGAAKLATTEAVIDKVIFGTKDKKFLWVITVNQAQFAATSQAIVKTGIDLNKIKPEDIKTEGKRISIELPAVQVLDFSYPFEKYQIDSSITRNAFLNKMSIEDHEYLYRQAELDIRRQLPYLGIKATTESKTRLLLEGLLRNLGYEEIYISFKEDGEFIPQVNLEYEES